MKIFIKEFLISALRLISRILGVFRDSGLPPPAIFASGYYAYKRFINEVKTLLINSFKSSFLKEEKKENGFLKFKFIN